MGALGGCSGDHGEASGEPRGTLDPPQASQECPGDPPGPPKTPLDAPEEAQGEPRASPGEDFFDFWKTLYSLRKTLRVEAGDIRGAPRGSLSGPSLSILLNLEHLFCFITIAQLCYNNRTTML